MKKLFVIVAAIGLMYSCGSNTPKQQEPAAQAPTKMEPKQTPDGHNPKNSLDYMGTYTGKIPTVGGDAVSTTIELGNSTFVKKVQSAGKVVVEQKGKYTWNSEGNTITLEGVQNSSNKYFVGENTLIQLDADGNKITGDKANEYVLRK